MVIFADIEELLIGYLSEQLALYSLDTPVATRIPSPRPDSCVVLMRTGGIPPTIISDDAQVAVECRAPSEHEAASLSALVRGLMHAAEGELIDGVMIYRVGEASGPSNYPDSTTPDQARYTQLFTIHYRGVVLAPLDGVAGQIPRKEFS